MTNLTIASSAINIATYYLDELSLLMYSTMSVTHVGPDNVILNIAVNDFERTITIGFADFNSLNAIDTEALIRPMIHNSIYEAYHAERMDKAFK